MDNQVVVSCLECQGTSISKILLVASEAISSYPLAVIFCWFNTFKGS